MANQSVDRHENWLKDGLTRLTSPSRAGAHTINLSSALPNITDDVLLDGWSQAGFFGTSHCRERRQRGCGDGPDVTASGFRPSAAWPGRLCRHGLVINADNTIVTATTIGVAPME